MFFDATKIDSNPYTGRVPELPEKWPSLWLKLGAEWVDINNLEGVEFQILNVEEDFDGRDVFTVSYNNKEYTSFGVTGSQPG